MKTERPSFAECRGLNNTSDPMSLGLSWLTRADNVVVSGQKKLKSAPGHVAALACTSVTGAYVTRDFQRFYLADAGVLYQVFPPSSARMALVDLGSDAPIHFAEVNGVVYYSNGTDLGVIEGSTRRQWGIDPPGAPDVAVSGGSLAAGQYILCCVFVDDRGMPSSNGDVTSINIDDGVGIAVSNIPQRDGFRTDLYATVANDDVLYRVAEGVGTAYAYGSTDQLDREIPFLFCSPPHGTLPALFGTRMYIAEPYPADDATAIWRSAPQSYHLFDDSVGIRVPGTVLMMAACDSALIIGTERAIYSMLPTGALTMEAPYGVVPGYHADRLGSDLVFWSLRGLCRALPFQNLTETSISVAPGVAAGGAVVEADGYRRYLACLQSGGEAYNPWQG